MKFGVREICDVVFKSLQTDPNALGGKGVKKGQPVLYIDSAKTSTIEGAATTVYAQGGKGNARLIAWEGEKTLTFTVEDALLSPIGFSILSGAGLFEADTNNVAYVHTTAIADVDGTSAVITLDGEETVATNAPLFVMEYSEGSIGGLIEVTSAASAKGTDNNTTITLTLKEKPATTQVFVDFYIQKKEKVTELQIDAENFAGYYYVEASTLFRRESDGKDLPAEIVFPKVKIQSNFTFTMASSGDPSTFTFTMYALPAYTMFNKKKKALCAIQVIGDSITASSTSAVTLADDAVTVAESTGDSGSFGA
jgi:hypothetical protein